MERPKPQRDIDGEVWIIPGTRSFEVFFPHLTEQLQHMVLSEKQAERCAMNELEAIARSCLRSYGHASEDNVKELTQMLIVRVAEKDCASKYNPDRGKPYVLLYTIAKNLWYDKVFRKNGQRLVFSDLSDLSSRTPNLLDSAVQQENFHILERCLMQLSGQEIHILLVEYGPFFAFSCDPRGSQRPADIDDLQRILNKLRSLFQQAASEGECKMCDKHGKNAPQNRHCHDMDHPLCKHLHASWDDIHHFVQSHCRRKLSGYPHIDPDDATQEALIQILKCGFIEKYDPQKSSMQGYICSVANNMCKKLVSKHRWYQQSLTPIEIAGLISRAPTPDEEASWRELLEDIRSARHRLTPTEQEALPRVLERASRSRCSGRTGIRPNYSAESRCRSRLRTLISRHNPDADNHAKHSANGVHRHRRVLSTESKKAVRVESTAETSELVCKKKGLRK